MTRAVPVSIVKLKCSEVVPLRRGQPSLYNPLRRTSERVGHSRVITTTTTDTTNYTTGRDREGENMEIKYMNNRKEGGIESINTEGEERE